MTKQPFDEKQVDMPAANASIILVVEDDAALQKLTGRILERAGYQVAGCRSGSEAIACIEDNPPALFLLDYSLPDMSGNDVIQRLEQKGIKVPFIVTTGRGDEQIAVEMMKLGARDYMVKDSLFLSRLPVVVEQVMKQITVEEQLAQTQHRLYDNRKQMELMERAIAASNIAISITNMNGIYTYVNQSFLKMWGYENEQEVIGQSVNDCCSIDKKELFNELDRKETWTGEVEAIRKDGSTFDSRLTVDIINDDNGKPIYRMGSFIDISERKAMEEALKLQNRQLDDANKAKSLFLANMSHELRTPLNAIIGFSELILDGMTGDINDDQRQCMTDICSSGRHLLGLINDILDLSKVEAGKMEMKPANTDIRKIIQEVAETMKPLLADKQQDLKLKIPAHLPQVYADGKRLEQVLMNLLSNAVKFTPPNGKIKVSVCDAGRYCRISVEDNGIGIKKEDQEKIFDAFTQLNAEGEKIHTGTGLGLKISRQFVEKMGGKMDVVSEEGEGSVFTFTLPVTIMAIPLRGKETKKSYEAVKSKIEFAYI